MFGGTPSRNLVNTVDKNIPTTWTVDDELKNCKNVKWFADLGSKALRRRRHLRWQNLHRHQQRSAAIRDKDKDGKAIDKGVLMCFNQADGKFGKRFSISCRPVRQRLAG